MPARPSRLLLFVILACSEAFYTPLKVGRCTDASTSVTDGGTITAKDPSVRKARNENGNIDDDREVDPSGAVNVLGTPLRPCCNDVGGTGIGTGFYRNGYCCTGEQDLGRHTVCCQVSDEFLAFSKAVGNDLSTPAPQYMFPGLKEGDIWCLCAQRWARAYNAGKGPKVFLHATHEKTLDYAPFEVLRKFAIDGSEADERLAKLNEEREKLNRLL
jgi:uncharacterized protein (DUF2237 family)